MLLTDGNPNTTEGSAKVRIGDPERGKYGGDRSERKARVGDGRDYSRGSGFSS